MIMTFKTFAIAAVAASTSMPAFADGHISISMSCEGYNQLSGTNCDKVAMMAIAELSDNVSPSDGTATVTAASVGTTGGTESASGTGTTSAQATTTTNAGDDMTHMEKKMAILNYTCSRNWDAKAMEAAAGQSVAR